jgi:rubredoxin
MRLQHPGAGDRSGLDIQYNKESGMKVWQCVICNFIYDEAAGLPEEGINPGTAWADIPENWKCPECGVAKRDFEMIEI